MSCPRTAVSHTFSKIFRRPRAVLDSLRLRPWPLGATPQGGEGGRSRDSWWSKIVTLPGKESAL